MEGLIIGIDPGQTGAIAFVSTHDGGLLEVHDMPVVDKEVSPLLLSALLAAFVPMIAVVEQVHSMPKQGVASSFKFGCSYGIVRGVLAGHQIRTEYVTPARWKKAMRLTSDKELSRRRAIDRWPAHAELFKLKKHDGRAEAALLALWWLEQQGGAA